MDRAHPTGGVTMRITVLGTGMVGRALAGRLDAIGHDVVVGTRDPATTLARTDPDVAGTPPYAVWAPEHPSIRLVTLPEAGEHAEMVVNATAGTASIAALQGARLRGRPGLWIRHVPPPRASPPDGPMLTVAITDSLAEGIQRALPATR